jgi:hypothetical protein
MPSIVCLHNHADVSEDQKKEIKKILIDYDRSLLVAGT